MAIGTASVAIVAAEATLIANKVKEIAFNSANGRIAIARQGSSVIIVAYQSA